MSNEAPEMVEAGPRWRVAFTVGFLDGDSARPRAGRLLSYVVGWKVGYLFARLRERAN